jgi:TolA-binding protein
MFRRLFVFFAFALALAANSVSPAAAQDAADAIVRLNRLESQFRQISGQMEQLQYENRQLKEQLRKFQEDVEFRFQEGRGGSRPSSPTTTPSRPAQPPAQSAAPQRPLRPLRSAGCSRRSSAARNHGAVGTSGGGREPSHAAAWRAARGDR